MKQTVQFSMLLLCFLGMFSCKQKTHSKKQQTTFIYTPTKPVQGKLKGVVELGTSGFNSFVIEVDKNKNWILKDREYGVSLISEGMTNTHVINQKLQDYIQKLLHKGLDSSAIHFVVSSGAIKEDLTKLMVNELKNIGHEVKVVSPHEEAKFALKSALPKGYHENSFVVDLGSGNTKISFLKDSIVIGLETHGSKYHQKGAYDEEVYEEVSKIASKVPKHKSKYCFILGGVPYQMASPDLNQKKSYIPLSNNANHYNNLAAIKGKKVQSGLNIYKAIVETTKCEEVIFFNDGNFTIGFLLEQPF
ncbi:hypothetical protein [Tenacibaculum geojense]|uniref:Ppx/GppA phosphatase domain-containing protein n=1 Tax=Tenacibaculum geojense TaxID=915352 RepID=A0ABW3JPE9_9FLAO